MKGSLNIKPMQKKKNPQKGNDILSQTFRTTVTIKLKLKARLKLSLLIY